MSLDMSRPEYKVGYKRPPQHTQFKPGQSGNPRGRPKQKKSLAELLQEILFRTVILKENGEPRRMMLIEVIANDLIHKAARGDAKARRDLLEILRRHPKVASPRMEIRQITDDMSPQEAADIYAATLTAIPGLTEPDE
jgi:hypothetical protein